MLSMKKKALIVIIAACMIFADALASAAAAYADVGSIAEGEDITYDKNGGVLQSLGFDTSKVPDTYDPDATTNPYGSNVSTMNEVKEQVLFERNDSGSVGSTLYGHNKALNGKIDTFTGDPVVKDMGFLDKPAFMSSVKCDINGDGRDSAVAIVYTYYDYSLATSDDPGSDVDNKIYMRIYDPKTGNKTDPFEIASIEGNRLIADYMVQSQLQITAGDYNKDSIDEIAVYAPAKGETDRNKVMFFTLPEGPGCQNPYSKNSWRQSWNYVLPLSSDKVINTAIAADPVLTSNIYNSLDLTSGDADNDGICDLIISYGASDTAYLTKGPLVEKKIVRSIPSRSVLLYGNDSGQMLKDSQELSYGGETLIRVSFAFGDIDGDGNEDLFLGGQEQSEQEDNVSRVLAKYVYDGEDSGMQPETFQTMKVIEGSQDGDDFRPSNGWDKYYYSAPMMKANIAIGNLMGNDSNVKIYMDSVLYSYDDGNYEIYDELEDLSTYEDEYHNEKYKGSHLLADMKGYMSMGNIQSYYYEYGADAGNFTGSVADCVSLQRVSLHKGPLTGDIPDRDVEARSEMIYLKIDKNNKPDGLDKSTHTYTYKNECMAPPVNSCSADTDKDSLIAIYTGEHEITYQDPDVLAVLASAPYFKDVAAYDNGDMLQWCSTSFGSSDGTTHGYTNTYSGNLGVFLNTTLGSKAIHAVVNLGAGYSRSETWGWERDREFSVSYDTAGGEDAVVMYSVPTENYVYKVEGVTVDDDGNIKTFTQKMIIAKPHNPVTQTLTLEDYMEIQRRQEKTEYKLPDVSKYLTSTPGYPSTYPKSENDLPADVTKHIYQDPKDPEEQDADNNKIDVGKDWFGISYGSGTETQTISYSKSSADRYQNHMDGAFGSIEAGIGTDESLLGFVHTSSVFLHYDWNRVGGYTNSTVKGREYSGTVANMPRSAKGYGYDFSWKLFKYIIKDDNRCTFPVVTYLVDDVSAPPELPDNIVQDHDNTTDSQIALTWTYNHGNPLGFDIYRYEDFPIGGGDKLVGTVGGSEYRLLKDDNGNTLRDEKGNVIRSYTFVDTDLTADTKYSYRMKARTAKLPGESIFSPVIEARTDVGEKPALSLSTDSLKIYADGTYDVKVNLADPENYQKEINYQWQKYNDKKHKWEDLNGCDKQKLHFYNCKDEDAGNYRCRVNLIRKVESHPQYISTFTEACKVTFSLRDVSFSNIKVFDGQGLADVNTGISVKVYNASNASLEKPTGTVTFTIKGPNGPIQVGCDIDEATGLAEINSIEDLIGTIGQDNFVSGGYLITASYGGSSIFYPSDDAEEYHYLRNIDECMFLSTKSAYYFGEDVAGTTALYDYKITDSGKVKMTDFTDKLTTIKIYKVKSDGISKDGDPIGTFDLTGKDKEARIPFNKKLARKAYIEAYIEGSDEAVASNVVDTMKIAAEFDVKDKVSGTGDVLEFLEKDEDLSISNGVDVNVTIETDDGDKKLSDFILFNYYEQNGEFICDSDHTDDHKDDFIPASYYADVELIDDEDDDDVHWFFKPTYRGGSFMVVGNYYLVSAGPLEKSSGSVKMISPDSYIDFEEKGYIGGSQIVLKAVPNKGYEISKWIIDECGEKNTVLPGTEKLTYTVKTQNTTGDGKIRISADMVPKDNRLTYSAIGKGAVTVSPEVESGLTVLAETKLTFTARPDEGWSFDEWHWTSDGGNSTVSDGVAQEDGSNVKTFTMPDNSATIYAVFKKNTIDVKIPDGIDVAYVNDGSDPHYDDGVTVMTEKGKDVPKGVKVICSCKPGIMLMPGAEWTVTVTTPRGIIPVDVEQFLVDGRPAIRFDLPDDVTGCAVQTDTMKGRFSIFAEAEEVDFAARIDGQDVEMTDGTLNDIESGSQVDIIAKPVRGRKLATWIVNGEEKEANDTTYSLNITENLTISATTKDEEKYDLKLSTEGGGIGSYAITDANGEIHEGSFQGAETAVDVYRGEAVTFSASPDNTSYTMTALFMNGVQQELDEGEFTISGVASDISIMCRFGTNKYHDVTFRKSGKVGSRQVYDNEDAEILDGDKIKVPDDGTLEFYVITDSSKICTVLVNGEKLAPASNTGQKISYKLENVKNSATIEVTDHAVWAINNEQDLINYFDVLADNSQPGNQPNAVLNADIEMSEGAVVRTPLYNYASFDGQGHTISGLTYGSENSRINDFNGIFGELMSIGEVKNVHLKDVKVYAERRNTVGAGIVTYSNEGHITGVAITGDSMIDYDCGNHNEPVGALAFFNKGNIDNCYVRDLFIKSRATVFDGDTTKQINNVGTGVVAESDDPSNIRCNYVENLKLKGSDMDGDHVTAIANIVTMASRRHNEMYENNYFKQIYRSKYAEEYGISIYSLTEDPLDEQKATAEAETPEFIRYLAGTMNSYLEDKAWGTSGADKADLFPTALDGGIYHAPVKADFSANGKEVTQYLYPGSNILPGRDVFEAETPIAWVIGDVAYTPESVVDLTDDITINGIQDVDDYVAYVSSDETGAAEYHMNIRDAVKSAMDHKIIGPQTLTVKQSCTLEDTTFIADDTTTVDIKDGVVFTLRKDAQIITKKAFRVEQGAVMHKYGSMRNEGVMSIEDGSTLYNYGSTLENTGVLTGQKNIVCRPHVCEEWHNAEEPDVQGRWLRTSTCQVCGTEITEEVKPDPPASKIYEIVISSEPDRVTYEVGDRFNSSGLVVTAVLTDGTKTSVKSYKLLYTVNDEKFELEDGFIMNKEGSYDVTVRYEGFTADFNILILNTKELLSVTDEEGNEPDEIETESGQSIALTASLKSRVPYQTSFLWTSDDREVIRFDGGDTGAVKNLIAGKPGKADITVQVLDEKGNVIQAIDPVTIKIVNVSHITDIRILGGDIRTDKSSSHEMKVSITPSDTTDDVEWSSSDEKVAVVDQDGIVTAVGGGEAAITVSAPSGLSDSRRIFVHEKAKDLTLVPDSLNINAEGFDGITAMVENGCANGEVTWTTSDASIVAFFVRNAETGEMETADTITTKLSADGNGTSDTYAIVTGIGEGNAQITAETESESGGVLTKECQVTVGQSDKYVYITHNGARCSGESLELSLDGRFLQLGSESSEEDDTFTWTTLDDSKDPVIKVDSTGGVTLKRKGTAAVEVTSDLTGETDIVLIKVIIRPSGIKLSNAELSIEEGGKRTLTATLVPDGAEGKVLWSSSDTSVAKVSDDGVVTAVREGEATIKAVPDNLDAEPAFCTVKVHSNKLTVELSKTSYIFDGKKKKPSVTVKCGSTVIASGITESDSNVMLMYEKNSWLPGTYTVTAIARDTEYGSGTAKYKIKVKPTAIKKIKKGSKRFTVRWKKVPKKNVKGYLVRYSTKKSMKKAKYKTVKGYNKTKLTVKNLKGGKKYYVQVRSLFYRHGVKYYSAWSKKKTVKTKK